MKILSYNINRSTQEKIDKIVQSDADVLIFPYKKFVNLF